MALPLCVSIATPSLHDTDFGTRQVVVLFIDLCYLHNKGTESEIEQRRTEIQDALQLFRYVYQQIRFELFIHTSPIDLLGRARRL
jgi:hypothetical protein